MLNVIRNSKKERVIHKPFATLSVSQKILDEALDKISLLTGLNQIESLVLMTEQLTKKNNKMGIEKHSTLLAFQTPVAILEQNEVTFISDLFH